jgi:hypothetical protein
MIVIPEPGCWGRRPWSAVGKRNCDHLQISSRAAGRGVSRERVAPADARSGAPHGGTLLTWRYWSHRALWHFHTGDGCRTAADPEFAVDVLQVLGDGPRADLQPMGDGGVGTAVSDKSQDLDLALGQIGKPAASRRGQRLPGLLASASPEQGSAQREPEHAVQGAIVVGEVVTPPVHGHADNLLLGAEQADGYLVFDRCGAKELCIQAEAVESLPGEEVADP